MSTKKLKSEDPLPSSHTQTHTHTHPHTPHTHTPQVAWLDPQVSAGGSIRLQCLAGAAPSRYLEPILGLGPPVEKLELRVTTIYCCCSLF